MLTFRKSLKFIGLGMLFGIVMTKAEIVSWFRIYEMFHFQSFHMYGVILSAIVVGIGLVQYVRRSGMHTMYGEPMALNPKNRSIPRYLFGGIIFGLGWALAGACPGPMYILVGNGFLILLVVIFSALLGTFLYGLLKSKLPH